jgi:hypothetical protein
VTRQEPPAVILHVTFDFETQDLHARFTIPVGVVRALNLRDDGFIHLDVWTPGGHASGDFLMRSKREIYVNRDPNDPNQPLVRILKVKTTGVATASRPAQSS